MQAGQTCRGPTYRGPTYLARPDLRKVGQRGSEQVAPRPNLGDLFSGSPGNKGRIDESLPRCFRSTPQLFSRRPDDHQMICGAAKCSLVANDSGNVLGVFRQKRRPCSTLTLVATHRDSAAHPGGHHCISWPTNRLGPVPS